MKNNLIKRAYKILILSMYCIHNYGSIFDRNKTECIEDIEHLLNIATTYLTQECHEEIISNNPQYKTRHRYFFAIEQFLQDKTGNLTIRLMKKYLHPVKRKKTHQTLNDSNNSKDLNIKILKNLKIENFVQIKENTIFIDPRFDTLSSSLKNFIKLYLINIISYKYPSIMQTFEKTTLKNLSFYSKVASIDFEKSIKEKITLLTFLQIFTDPIIHNLTFDIKEIFLYLNNHDSFEPLKEEINNLLMNKENNQYVKHIFSELLTKIEEN